MHSRQSLGGYFQSHAPHEPLESGGLQRGAPALPGAAVRREEPTQRGPSCLSTSVRCRHSLQEESSCRSGTLYRSRAEPRRAADCLQRSLRSRFRQQLTPSVAMTSHVKSWSQLFQVIMMLLSSVHRKRRSQEDPTVDHAAIHDLNLRDIDGRQIARPHEPGKLDSVASIGFDPVPGFFGTSEGATTQQRSFFLVR